MKKIILSILAIAIMATGAKTQNVNIPNAAFKAYLVGHSAINTNGDAEIQVSEANSFTGLINLQSANITDLTGIEAFTAITELKCNNNELTSLDVSANTALTLLHCGANELDAIDISANTALVEFSVFLNNLTTIDVSSNVNLDFISISYNDLVHVDLSNNTLLEHVYVDHNQLSSLNVASGNNTVITTFSSWSNSSLSCIQVDNPTYSTTNWTNIDGASSFSTNCGGPVATNEIIDNSISIYPNPVSSQLFIDLNDTKINQLEIIDCTGRVVKTITDKNPKSINISDLGKGLYILKVSTADGVSSKQFIKK